jgi:hypothetical protein
VNVSAVTSREVKKAAVEAGEGACRTPPFRGADGPIALLLDNRKSGELPEEGPELWSCHATSVMLWITASGAASARVHHTSRLPAVLKSPGG